MPESLNVGGVEFSVGMNTEEMEQALEQIKRNMAENADDMESIFADTMNKFNALIREAYAKQTGNMTDNERDMSNSYIRSIRGIQKGLNDFKLELELDTDSYEDELDKVETKTDSMLERLQRAMSSQSSKKGGNANNAGNPPKVDNEEAKRLKEEDELRKHYSETEIELAKEMVKKKSSLLKALIKLEEDNYKALKEDEARHQKYIDNQHAEALKEYKAHQKLVYDVDEAHYRALKEDEARHRKYIDGQHAEALKEYQSYKKLVYDIDEAHYKALKEDESRQQKYMDSQHKEALEEYKKYKQLEYNIDEAHYKALKEDESRQQKYMDSQHKEALEEYKKYKQLEHNIDEAHYRALKEDEARHQKYIDSQHADALREYQAYKKQEYDIDKAHWQAIQDQLKREVEARKKANDRIREDYRNTKAELKDLAKHATALGAATATVATVLGGHSLYDLLIGQQADYERTVNSFGLLINDAERAKKVMDDLRELAFETPYSVNDMSNTANTLASTDLYVSAIEDLVPRLGDLARGDSERLKAITKATMDIQNAGKVMGQEMNQLKDAGVPIIPELAKTMGVTVTQMRKLGEEGKITADIYRETIVRMTSEGGKYFGMMDMYAEDYLGRLEQVKSEFIELGMAIGEDVLEDITEYLEGVLEKFDEMKEDGSLQKVIDDISSMLVNLAKITNAVIMFTAEHPRLVEMALAAAGIATALGAVVLVLGTLASSSVTVLKLFRQMSRINIFKEMAKEARDAGKAVDDLTDSIKDNNNAGNNGNNDDGDNKKKSKLEKAGIASLVVGEALAIGKGVYEGTKWLGDKLIVDNIKETNKEVEKLDGTIRNMAKVDKDILKFDASKDIKEAATIAEEAASNLKEIQMSTAGALSIDDVQKQSDFVDKLAGLGMDISLFNYDEETKKITNLDSALGEMSKSFKENFTGSLVGDIQRELDDNSEFVAKITPQLEALGDEELDRLDLEKVFGRHITKSEFKDIKLRLDSKGYDETFAGLKKLYNQDINTLEGRMTELKDSINRNTADIDFGDMLKSWNDGIKEATANAKSLTDSLKLASSSSLEVVANLDDRSLLEKWDALQTILQTGSKDISAELTESFRNIKLVPNSGDFEADIATYKDSLTGIMDTLEQKLYGGSITLEQYRASVQSVADANEVNMRKYAEGMGQLGAMPAGLMDTITEIVNMGGEEAIERIDAVNEHVTEMSQSVGVKLQDVGLKSSKEVNSLFSKAESATQDKALKRMQDRLAQYEEEKERAEAERNKTPEQRANEAMSLLSRQLEVEMITGEQFRKKAEAIRTKYYKKGTLEYLEYTKDMESKIDSFNTSRIQKEKDALDKQLNLSVTRVGNESYSTGLNSDQIYKEFERMQRLEAEARRKGVKSEEEYQADISQIGSAAFDARMAQHERFIKQQQQTNNWSYSRQVSYYAKMSKEVNEAYRKGLIDYQNYAQKIEDINSTLYDGKVAEIERLMNAQMASVRGKYDAEVKEINDFYDKIDSDKSDKERKDRLKELIKLEKQFAGATNMGAKDRLKEIQDEIADIRSEEEDLLNEKARQTALDKVETKFNKFESSFEKAMDNIGKYATDKSKSVEKAVDAMVKSFGKLPNMDVFNGNKKSGAMVANGGISVVNHNTINVKNTSQAVALGKSFGVASAKSVMSKGGKK